MKKKVLLVLCMLCYLLVGCVTTEQKDMNKMNKNTQANKEIGENLDNNIAPGTLPDVSLIEQPDNFSPVEIEKANLVMLGDAIFKIEQQEDSSYKIWVLKYTGIYENAMSMYLVQSEGVFDKEQIYQQMIDGENTIRVRNMVYISGVECAYFYESAYNIGEKELIQSDEKIIWGTYLEGELKLYNSSEKTEGIQAVFDRTIERYRIQ